MYKALLFLLIFIPADQAYAHITHIGQLAEHGHIGAGIAIGLAGVIALIKIFKNQGNEVENEIEDLKDEIQEVL